MMLKKKFVIPLICIALLSCNVIRISQTKEEIQDNMDEPKSWPKIWFINLKMYYDQDSDSTIIELINYKLVEGKLKQDNENHTYKGDGGLICSFITLQNELIKQITIENPLQKTVEYSDENGKLMKKKVSLDNAEFSIRISSPEEIRYIKFEKPSGRNNFLHLFTIELK